MKLQWKFSFFVFLQDSRLQEYVSFTILGLGLYTQALIRSVFTLRIHGGRSHPFMTTFKTRMSLPKPMRTASPVQQPAPKPWLSPITPIGVVVGSSWGPHTFKHAILQGHDPRFFANRSKDIVYCILSLYEFLNL